MPYNNWLIDLLWQGEKIKSELLELVRELPTNVYQPIADKVKGLQEVITYYEEFVKFVSGK